MFRTGGIVRVSEPLVAFTRIVFEPVSWMDCDGVLLPPSQPISPPIETAEITRRQIINWMRRLTFRIRQMLMSDTAKSKAPIPRSSASPAVWGAVLVILKEVVALPPDVIFACAGLKLQFIPTGSPVQVKLTVPASPDSEFTCNVTGEEVVP